MEKRLSEAIKNSSSKQHFVGFKKLYQKSLLFGVVWNWFTFYKVFLFWACCYCMHCAINLSRLESKFLIFFSNFLHWSVFDEDLRGINDLYSYVRKSGVITRKFPPAFAILLFYWFVSSRQWYACSRVKWRQLIRFVVVVAAAVVVVCLWILHEYDIKMQLHACMHRLSID